MLYEITVRWSGGDGGGCVRLVTDTDDPAALKARVDRIDEMAPCYPTGQLDEITCEPYKEPAVMLEEHAVKMAATYAGVLDRDV